MAAETYSADNLADIPRYDISYNPSDVYMHAAVTEAEARLDEGAMALLNLAYKTHGEGYVQNGLIDPSAVVRGGSREYVVRDLDHSPGPYTVYRVAINPNNIDDVATLRKVGTPPGGDYRDLPAYGMVEPALHAEGRAYLESLRTRGVPVYEIAALAVSNHGKPDGVHEIIRSELQRAAGSEEEWFFGIVTKTFGSFAAQWGKRNFHVVGEDATFNDSRVGEGIALRPTIVKPRDFFQNILLDYLEETDDRARLKLAKGFVYMTEGLDPAYMTPEMQRARSEMIAAGVGQRVLRAAPELSLHPSPVELQLDTLAEGPTEWSQPEVMDLASDDDWDRLRRLGREGRIQIIDRVSEYTDELLVIRYPRDEVGRAGLAREIKEQGEHYGSWVYFPWSRQLVHYPPMQDLRDVQLSRTRQAIYSEEHSRLYNANVAVFGLSVGSSIVQNVLKDGVAGHLTIADPDHLAGSNLGRVAGDITNVGEAKLDMTAKRISMHDPYLFQTHLVGPVSREALEAIPESRRPHLIFDEVDDLPAKAAIRAYAAEHRIPVIMVTDLGDRSVVDIERYDLDEGTLPFGGKLTAQEFSRLLSGDADMREIVAYRLRMFEDLLPTEPRLREALEDLQSGALGGGLTQLGSTATIGGGVGAKLARELLLGRRAATGRYVVSTPDALNFEMPPSHRPATLRRLGRAARLFAWVHPAVQHARAAAL